MPPRSVFVTGASGFIGRALCERFRSEGADVRGMDLVPDADRNVVAGDVGEPGAWQDHASGCELVVHAAAIVSMRLERPDEVWRANVLGTHHALQAAIRGGARRLVHFSSVTAFGFRFPDGVDESYPVHLTGVPYADTKIASEQHVLQAHAEARVAATVVRPGDVYGPGARAWAVLPVELLKARRFVLPAGGRGLFSPVYVDDLVEGVVAAAGNDQAAGHVITLSGGVGVENRRFFGAYADALGVPLRTAPLSVARAAAGVAHALGRLTPGDVDVNARSIDYMTRTGTYSIAKAERLLGWRPQIGVDEGLERTLQWLRGRGLVP